MEQCRRSAPDKSRPTDNRPNRTPAAGSRSRTSLSGRRRGVARPAGWHDLAQRVSRPACHSTARPRTNDNQLRHACRTKIFTNIAAFSIQAATTALRETRCERGAAAIAVWNMAGTSWWVMVPIRFARSRLNGNRQAGVCGGQAAGRYKKLGRIPEGGKRILSQFFEFLRMWRMCNTARLRVAESLRRRGDL